MVKTMIIALVFLVNTFGIHGAYANEAFEIRNLPNYMIKMSNAGDDEVEFTACKQAALSENETTEILCDENSSFKVNKFLLSQESTEKDAAIIRGGLSLAGLVTAASGLYLTMFRSFHAAGAIYMVVGGFGALILPNIINRNLITEGILNRNLDIMQKIEEEHDLTVYFDTKEKRDKQLELLRELRSN